MNYYRRFIKHASEIQRPLNHFLKGNKRNDKTVIQWNDEARSAFSRCKTAINAASEFQYHDPDSDLVLMVDASNTGIGGALHHDTKDGLRPLAFYSTKLTPAQQKYSTYDRELLAAYLSVKHFKPWLEARHFVILTDHKPLTFAFQQNLDKASPRQQRHLQYLAQFTTEMDGRRRKNQEIKPTRRHGSTVLSHFRTHHQGVHTLGVAEDNFRHDS